MLETLWFAVWAALWAVFMALDGFDLGAGGLMPFLARNEDERGSLLNSVGPYWDGNEVWLVAAGGITFAAFPGAYAAIFSSLYALPMLVLFALIVRGAALGFRGEAESPGARRLLDLAFFLGSLAAPLFLGIAYANLLKGVPLSHGSVYVGSLADLFGPAAILGGLLALAVCLMHGCAWLALKSSGDLQQRAASLLPWLLVGVILLLIAWVFVFVPGLFGRYAKAPALLLLPLLCLFSLAWIGIFIQNGAWRRAWAASAGFIFFGVLAGFAGIYPDMLRSSLDEAFSLAVGNAASSPRTLMLMLGVVAIFLPAIVAAQVFAYRLFRGKASPGGYGHG